MRVAPIHSIFSITAILSIASLLVVSGCKNTEDYLSDLRTSVDKDGKLNLAVYDAGLLVHEGFAGLMDQDLLTLSQVGRAVHRAGELLEKNEIALCRADAVATLNHMALRFPIPPLDSPVSPEKDGGKIALQQVDILEQETRLLLVPEHIAALGSPDRVVVERARDQLVTLTGQPAKADAAAWEAWWAVEKPAVLARVSERCGEPLRIVGNLRYRSLSEARAVLGYVSAMTGYVELAGIDQLLRDSILRTARQVVVYGILKAIQDTDPAVRMDAARAAGAVLDHVFGAGLVNQYPREPEADCKVAILKSLAFYPSKGTLECLILGFRDRDRAVQIVARRSLVTLLGFDLGDDAREWLAWYTREGKSLWP